MELTVFNNSAFGEIRTIVINNEPYFVGKDVCEAFGDTNYRRSLSNIDEFDKCIVPIDTKGGRQNMTLVNESGLYSLLFQMQPQKAKGVSQNDHLIEERKLKLKKFKRWVTSEVLPSIRKNGMYIANQEWLEARSQSKQIRIAEASVIQKLVEYAKDQGSKNSQMLYMTYSKLANKAANISNRDLASALQLMNLTTIENVVANMIIDGMNKGMHYKDIYQETKQRVEQVQELAFLERPIA